MTSEVWSGKNVFGASHIKVKNREIAHGIRHGAKSGTFYPSST